MSEPYVGEIRMFGGNFAPRGWAFCDGQLLPVSQYDALFSLIGTIYGGDGQTTFALPDLRGRIPIHQGTGAGLTPRSLGNKGGAETVTLTVSQVPAHTHTARASASAGDQTTPESGLWADSGQAQYAPGPANAVMRAPLISATGGSQPHTNFMPYLCVSFIIALVGLYPSRA